jgi:hypothetical protein
VWGLKLLVHEALSYWCMRCENAQHISESEKEAWTKGPIIYVSSYYYVFVLVLLYMCPHTTIYVSDYYLLSYFTPSWRCWGSEAAARSLPKLSPAAPETKFKIKPVQNEH